MAGRSMKSSCGLLDMYCANKEARVTTAFYMRFLEHWMPPCLCIIWTSCYVQLCHSPTRYVNSEECKHCTLSTKLFKHVTTSWCEHHKMFQAAVQEEPGVWCNQFLDCTKYQVLIAPTSAGRHGQSRGCLAISCLKIMSHTWLPKVKNVWIKFCFQNIEKVCWRPKSGSSECILSSTAVWLCWKLRTLSTSFD
jgi:hypothetical protein